MVAGFKAQTWFLGLSVTGCHVSCLTLVSSQDSSLRGEKDGQWHLQTDDLLALDLEEESLVEEFWVPLLRVMCPLLSLCCVVCGGAISRVLTQEAGGKPGHCECWSTLTWWGGESCSPSGGTVLVDNKAATLN